MALLPYNYGQPGDPNFHSGNYVPPYWGFTDPSLATPAPTAPATTPAVQPSGPVTDYNPATGGKPSVPNLGDIQRQTTASNIGALPSIEAFAGGVNQFNAAEALRQLQTNLPGYTPMTEASSRNIQSDLAGVISPDVKNQIIQTAAERGISTGLYDSPNNDSALLAALGKTSDALKVRGQSELTGAINRTPTAPLMDLTRLMISPTDMYEAQLLANIYAAAPSPNAATQALLNTQRGGYNAGRSNVPGAAAPATSTGSTASPTGRGGLTTAAVPDAQSEWVWDNQAGAYYSRVTGQYSDTPGGQPWEGFTYAGVHGSRAGGAPGWQWDESLGAFYNAQTGEVSDNPEGGYSTGLASNYNTPAQEAPMSEEDFYAFND